MRIAGYNEVMPQGMHLSQRLTQSLVLAPQLQQSLALLQAPTLELKALVEAELQQNPVLEEASTTEAELQEKEEREEEAPAEGADPSEPPADLSFDPAAEKGTSEPVDDFEAEFERLAQLDQEWRDHFAQTNVPLRTSAEEEEKRQFMFDSLVAGTSLQEMLLEQVRESSMAEALRPVAEIIIGNIDDYGYLKATLEELAAASSVPLEKVLEVLKTIQGFEPPGVGARDLRECLMLQLERTGQQNTLEYRIISEFMEALGKRRTDAAQYGPLVVAWRNGAPVRLQDVGRAVDSVENDKTAAWYFQRGQGMSRAIVLAIQRQPGTNTVAVAGAVRRLLPQFRAQLPASVGVNVLFDRSVPIQESVRDVRFTLLLTLALVVLVIFLFLRNVPATIIPSVAVPLSLVGTFGVMYLAGFSINNPNATIGLSDAIYPAEKKSTKSKPPAARDTPLAPSHPEARPRVILTLDDESKIEVETMLVVVSNTPMFGVNFLVAPHASLEDGLLDVSLYPNFSKAEVLAYYASVMNQGNTENDKVQHYRVSKLELKSKPPLEVNADAIDLGKGNVKIKCLKGALRVIAPDVPSGPNPVVDEKEAVSELPPPLSPPEPTTDKEGPSAVSKQAEKEQVK